MPHTTEPPQEWLPSDDGWGPDWEPDFGIPPKRNGNGHDKSAAAVKPKPLDPLTPLPIAEWANQEPPERKWIVPGLLARGSVALLSSDGGLGKSLLMMQLQCCAALGRQWLGRDIPKIRSIGYYCEDDPAELQRRLRDCIIHYETTEADLAEDMVLFSRAGRTTALVSFDPFSDKHGLTELYDQLMEATEETGAQMVIVDTVADTFDGNENVRPQVRQYVNQLKRFALKTDGGVILLAHPSVTGLSSGSGLSGSTAWHNTVRGRAYLEIAKDAEDPDERVLKFMKSNYSAKDAMSHLKWQNGVFVSLDAPSDPVGVVAVLSLEQAILETARKLVADGTRLAASTKAPNYAVKVLRDIKTLRNYTYGAVERCIASLMDDGRFVKIEWGPPSRCYAYLRPSDARYPGEK